MSPLHGCAGVGMTGHLVPNAHAVVAWMMTDPPASDPMGPGKDAAPDRDLRRRLDGSSILLVEDEAMVAMDIKFALDDFGAQVLGPAASLSDALALARNAHRIDAAILDIDLGGEDVFQLADLLVSRTVPFLFHTGGALVAGLESQFPNAGFLRKPVTVEDLLWSLVDRMS